MESSLECIGRLALVITRHTFMLISVRHRDLQHRSNWINGGFNAETAAPFDRSVGWTSSGWISWWLDKAVVLNRLSHLS